jgi:microcystin-dependent protein
LPADVTVTGSAGTAAATVKVNMVTGGTVTVQNNAGVPAAQPVSTQSPGLGMTVCIAVNGLYPSRPE